MGDSVVIDGSHGEGGGQILRTALTLSAITGRPLTIQRLRAGRPKPGLAAQHLTAVLSAAELCRAVVSGAALGSETLSFRPTVPPQAGDYLFDVAAAREGGSAGAATLVLQTVALVALFASGASRFCIRGGTHVPWSPSYDYIAHVWRPFLARMGIALEVELAQFGFLPVGQGEITARVSGLGSQASAHLKPVVIIARGPLRSVSGRAITANLPSHIAQRMVARATALLAGSAPAIGIRAEDVSAASPGAVLFLIAEYEHMSAGFNAFGARGKSSETVATEAAGALLTHLRSGAALDLHLADQALLPLALACAPSIFSCEGVTRHLETNARVIGQFGIADVVTERRGRGPALVSIKPRIAAAAAQGRPP
ncbi:MAG TPA: RNA 3'-terminal phosphate cyclase [Hyphomicrobiaceae bacterium]|nr:RNA 3'-terminal phosphate cyclase [Hyphomicrobiaceae bacterium]